MYVNCRESPSFRGQKTAVSQGSIYRSRGRNNWYWKFRWKGRAKVTALGTTSKPEAKGIASKLHAEYTSSPQIPETDDRDTSVEEFWNTYIQWARGHKRKSTVSVEEIWWKQFVEFCRPSTLGLICQLDVDRFKRKLGRAGAKRKPLKDESINDALRHAFASFHAISGTSIYKVSKWMGHSKVAVTERPYAGLKAYAARIGEFVGQADAFCDAHLNAEYKTLCREMACAICQKGSPVL